MGLFRYEKPSPSNPCCSEACIKPCDKPISISIHILFQPSGVRSDRAHPRDLAPVGLVEAKRTFLVMTKLVPGNAIS